MEYLALPTLTSTKGTLLRKYAPDHKQRLIRYICYWNFQENLFYFPPHYPNLVKLCVRHLFYFPRISTLSKLGQVMCTPASGSIIVKVFFKNFRTAKIFESGDRRSETEDETVKRDFL